MKRILMNFLSSKSRLKLELLSLFKKLGKKRKEIKIITNISKPSNLQDIPKF